MRNIVVLVLALAMATAQISTAQSVVAVQLPGSNSKFALSIDKMSVPAALDAIAKSSGIAVTYDSRVASIKQAVTVRSNAISLNDALSSVLRNTGLEYVISGSGVWVRPAAPGSKQAAGVITGKVTDAKTGKSISGANISVGTNTPAVVSTEDGAYRLTGVVAGINTITVRTLGYTKQVRQVTVGDGETVSADFHLEPRANVLDQVIVTGTVVQTELKTVPNAITVITAKQIEDRGITKIDQLFRGEVPGVFAQNQGSVAMNDEVTMFSRGATALSFYSAGTSMNTNPIKTYIDGVEIADSKYLNQIDIRSIERIEILTGPQASTIYGSNAINGVMQIFTKRGSTPKPQLTLNLLSGWVENNFSSARTPQHDYSGQMNGAEGRIAYNAGGGWSYVGPWTPSRQTTRTNGFTGLRLDFPTSVGQVTTDLSLRRNYSGNQVGGSISQGQTGYRQTGWWSPTNAAGVFTPSIFTNTGQTVGLTLGYAPTNWWSNELGLGQDSEDSENKYTERGFASTQDSTLFIYQSHTARRSIRYTSTFLVPVTSVVRTTLTFGTDAWQSLNSAWSVSPQALTGSLTGSTAVSRQPGHNTGGFMQTQIGLYDRFFITYGLRAEWNPNYGEDAQPNLAPRYGAAYTFDAGYLTTKLRASYGRSTRPPGPKLGTAQRASTYYGSAWGTYGTYYSDFDRYLANPDLLPEQQQGWEGGAELYAGNRASLVITRYNQTIDDLIAFISKVDSVRSIVPTTFAESIDLDGYGYFRQQQYLNVGSIRNQGWELQGNTTVGSLTLKGTYSWTKSRTIGVNPKYAALFANDRQYQRGATFQYLPEHTWGLTVQYVKSRTSANVSISGIGMYTNSGDDFFMKYLSGGIRLRNNRLNVSNTGAYVNFNSGYAMADLNLSHRIAERIEGLLQVTNLADRYVNDFSAEYAVIGRQTKVGFRLRP